MPALAAPESTDRQTYPSWSRDGGSILFSSSDENDSNPALRMVDLKTKRVSQLPGSNGLYWGQLSPDGRSVVALEDPTQRLMLYDMAGHNSRALADLADYPRWSSDGQSIYFSTLYFNRPEKPGAVYRWNVSSNTTETVLSYPDFLLAGAWGVCYGLTPEGGILLLRDQSTRDLYAIDVDLP